MIDRVYTSAKPTTTNGTTTTTNPSFPATKAQLYGATRPTYLPQSNHKQSGRSRCCACCIWITIIILTLILLAAIAGVVVYLLYRPHHPTFTVSALKISSLSLTSTSHLSTNINLNMTAKNPNKKVVYIYNPMTVTTTTEKDDILIGNGVLPSFVHGTKNTTLLKTSINGGQNLDDTSASKLKADLKSKNGVELKIEINTKVKAKMGGLKSPKVGIRISCQRIKATVPTGKTATTASVSNAKCKVDLRIKIWKWTF